MGIGYIGRVIYIDSEWLKTQPIVFIKGLDNIEKTRTMNRWDYNFLYDQVVQMLYNGDRKLDYPELLL